MKKLTLSLAVAGLVASSLSAYAAVPTGAAPFQVMVPNIKSGFDFMLEGLYIQPTASDLTYLGTSVTPSGSLNTNLNSTSFNPDYDFGFAVGVGYTFPNSGNALRVNWTHFNHSTDDAVLSTAGTTIVLPTLEGVPDTLGATQALNAQSSVSFKYDAVDLDMSQYMSIGTRFQTRLFAGLRYANLKQDLTNTYSYVDTTTALPISVDAPVVHGAQSTVVQDLKFEGIGPRLGIDTSYHVGDCFGVVAHFATALLVGRTESNVVLNGSYNATTTDGATTPTYTTATTINPTNTISSSNETRVVPAFDAKLGFDYTFGFNNDNSNMVIEAGYQVTQYVDVFRGGVPVVTSNQIGVGFNGPYLSLDFKL